MSAYVVTPPSFAIVSLAVAKAALAVDYTDNDRLIDRLIFAAQDWLADQYDISTAARTLELPVCGFSASSIRLPFPPVIAITSVKYDDTSGVEQSIAAHTIRLVQRSSSVFHLAPAYGSNWPTARSETASVRIRYTAGYQSEAVVPEPIRQAALLLVGDWYANREASTIGQVSREIALGVSRIMAPYRVWSA